MSTQTGQLERPKPAGRLHERVESLGVPLVWVEPEGAVAPLGECRWLERVVIASQPFAAAVRQAWPALSAGSSEAVPIWPGLWLVPMPTERRRRASSDRFQSRLMAALLTAPEFLDSDQFRLVCSAQQLDAQAARSRVDPAALYTDAEVRRLAHTLVWMQQDSMEIARRNGELQSMSRQLGDSYEELSLLYKLSTGMTVNQPPAQYLTEACRELQEVGGFRWMALQLVDDPDRLHKLTGSVFASGPVGCEGDALRQIGRQLMTQVGDNTGPRIIDDTTTVGIPELPALSRQLLVVPLVREHKFFGVLIGGDKLDDTHISSVDAKLCNSLAIGLTIFLENAMLYEDMQAMFMGTLHALTNSIDAKDSYTHGHSERVALVSRQLARAAGLPEETCERVYISALVHDVGKIGVPEAVLTKPGHLTSEEFALIKMHPEIGAHILRDIRQMQDLIPGVLYHHERWSGGGYPTGVAGEQIPLFGRLICLADSFDAMSSNRTYRQALTLEQVLHEIRRCAGTQFDPVLAELFVKLDFTEFFKMIEHHQSIAAGHAQQRGNTP
ncbi:MAG: HD domain-containing protein [Planctomycetes bacterium]|nr:HD domain-containing protein [Planctomycetota bacterium]